MKNLIKKIWNWIVNIPNDKLLHYDAGLLIALYSTSILFHFCPLWLTILAADAIALLILIGKEVYDSKHAGHSVELWDVLAGAFGALTSNLATVLMFL